MPDFRTQPSIAQRNDLRWHRRTVSLRRWYWRLSCVAVLAAALLLVAWTAIGDERVYWSAPVAHGHAMFQQDCKQCHVQQGAPLVRLASFNDSHHSVRDSDCQACHAQQSHDHATRMQQEMVTGCVECHREHVGRERLADVADQHCTQCHADLHVTSGSHAFAQHVPSFREHPEFLPWEKALTSEVIAQREKQSPLTVIPTSDGWKDPTQLRFNHAVHLVEVGVLTAVPKPGEEAKHVDRKQLACSDCHQPDAAGQYMQPINYEQHCAACHQLDYSERLAGPLPHESPETVYGLLRDRLMKYAEAHPEELAQASQEAPRLPNKQHVATAKDKWDYVEQQMNDAQTGELALVQNGCKYCHIGVENQVQDGNVTGFSLTPPGIPGRWLTSSRFDHGRHREVSCALCHDPVFASRKEGFHQTKSGLKTQLTSELSSDILMPRLENCQACHGERPMNGQIVGARARCVDCHDYHKPHAASSGKLDDWGQAKK